MHASWTFGNQYLIQLLEMSNVPKFKGDLMVGYATLLTSPKESEHSPPILQLELLPTLTACLLLVLFFPNLILFGGQKYCPTIFLF